MGKERTDDTVLYLFELAKGIVFNTKVATLTFSDVITDAIATIGEPTSERLPTGRVPLRRQLKEALNIIDELEKRDFSQDVAVESVDEDNELDYVEIL